MQTIPLPVLTRVMANNIAVAKTKYGPEISVSLALGYTHMLEQITNGLPDITFHETMAHLHAYVEMIAITQKAVPDDYQIPDEVVQAFDDYLISAEIEQIPEDQIMEDLGFLGLRYFSG